MSRHETYYQQRPVPCECGSHDAYWHGPEQGLREYCCDDCWDKRECVKALRSLVNTFDPDKQAIYEFARPQIEKAKHVIDETEGRLP